MTTNLAMLVFCISFFDTISHIPSKEQVLAAWIKQIEYDNAVSTSYSVQHIMENKLNPKRDGKISFQCFHLGMFLFCETGSGHVFATNQDYAMNLKPSQNDKALKTLSHIENLGEKYDQLTDHFLRTGINGCILFPKSWFFRARIDDVIKDRNLDIISIKSDGGNIVCDCKYKLVVKDINKTLFYDATLLLNSEFNIVKASFVRPDDKYSIEFTKYFDADLRVSKILISDSVGINQQLIFNYSSEKPNINKLRLPFYGILEPDQGIAVERRDDVFSGSTLFVYIVALLTIVMLFYACYSFYRRKK